MTTEDRPDFPRAACDHEAAQCVVGWCLGAWTYSAEVFAVPQAVAPGGGEASFRTQGRSVRTRILYTTLPPIDDRALRIAANRGEMELVIHAAGAVAEAWCRKRSAAFCWARDELDSEVCRRIAARTMPGVEAPMKDVFRCAAGLLRSRAGRPAFAAIAAHLRSHGRIDWNRIDAVCTGAYGRRRPSACEWDRDWPMYHENLRGGWLPDVPEAYPNAVGRGDLHLRGLLQPAAGAGRPTTIGILKEPTP